MKVEKLISNWKLEDESWKINFLNYKSSIKLIVEVVKKYPMT